MSKKFIKILSIILIVCFFVTVLTSNVSAAGGISDIIDEETLASLGFIGAFLAEFSGVENIGDFLLVIVRLFNGILFAIPHFLLLIAFPFM